MKIGFFGKLPNYGDFVQRNVSPSIINYWDNWILQALNYSKSELMENWKDCYFSSPIWRFHIQSGVVCEETISGLMMPSIDSAGRCYPFIVICRSNTHSDIFKLARVIDDCHAKCEEFLLHLLNENHPNLDEVCTKIGKFYDAINRDYIPEITEPVLLTQNEIFQYNGENADCFFQINECFLSFLAAQQCSSITIWNRAPSQNVHPQYRYFKGMPPVNTFSSFLIPVS